jgi:hypothetical protein
LTILAEYFFRKTGFWQRYLPDSKRFRYPPKNGGTGMTAIQGSCNAIFLISGDSGYPPKNGGTGMTVWPGSYNAICLISGDSGIRQKTAEPE